MENRRDFYRHAFALTCHFAVRLQSADGAVTLQAELINLSTGGMYVYAPALRTQSADQWIVSMSLETNAEPLIVTAERVHPPDGGDVCWGLRFLDDPDPRMTKAREKAIWRFLLDEQRRRWKLFQGQAEQPDYSQRTLPFPTELRADAGD